MWYYTSITIVQNYTGKYTSLLESVLLWVHSMSNTTEQWYFWYYGDNDFIVQTSNFIARSDAVHVTCSTWYRFLCTCSKKYIFFNKLYAAARLWWPHSSQRFWFWFWCHTRYGTASLVPRLLLPPVFDHLLYAKMEEQLRPGRFSHMRNVW